MSPNPSIVISDPAEIAKIMADHEMRKAKMGDEAIRCSDWGKVLALESSFTRVARMVSIWPMVPPGQRRQLL
jgi:hypothetical protein